MAPSILWQGSVLGTDGPGIDVIMGNVTVCITVLFSPNISFLHILAFPHHCTKHGIKVSVVYVWFNLKLQWHRKLSDKWFHSITEKKHIFHHYGYKKLHGKRETGLFGITFNHL